MTDVGLNSFEKMQVDADLFRLSKKKKEKEAGFVPDILNRGSSHFCRE